MKTTKLALVLIALITTALLIAKVTLAASPSPASKRNLQAVCQANLLKTKQNLLNITNLAQAMLTQIDGIHTRVVSHYSLITLPSKKTVANFETIENTLSKNKTTITNSLKRSTIDIAQLNCNSLEALSNFTIVITNLRQTINLIDTYKSGVRTLITSIIAADQSSNPGGNATQTPSSTPPPSTNPSLTPSLSPSSSPRTTASPSPSTTASPSPSTKASQAPGAALQ